VLPVCINASYWDNVMERMPDGALGLRLGFRQIKSMREEESAWISAARGNGYHAVEDVWRRAGVEPRLLRVLAEADAFATLGLSRREALWAARALASDTPLPLFAGDMDGEGIVEAPPRLPAMTEGEEVVEDYVAMRLTLRRHPMAFLRESSRAACRPRTRRTPRASPAPPASPAPTPGNRARARAAHTRPRRATDLRRRTSATARRNPPAAQDPARPSPRSCSPRPGQTGPREMERHMDNERNTGAGRAVEQTSDDIDRRHKDVETTSPAQARR
jgi:hypothetical protein